MGNDGGSIPTRRELVQEAARKPTLSELKATALESLSHAWSHCRITDEALDMDNTVSDSHGHLYNYESILNHLVPPADDSDLIEPEPQTRATFEATGIKSVRDIVKLQFQHSGSKGKGSVSCPVSMKELGPSTKSVYIVPCGHTFSEVAITEIAEKVCPSCSEPFNPRDIIPILHTSESEIIKLDKRMSELKAEGLTHSLKKDKSASKKSKKNKGDKEDKPKSESRGEKRKATEEHRKTEKRTAGINNPSTAAFTKEILEEQEQQERRRRLISQK